MKHIIIALLAIVVMSHALGQTLVVRTETYQLRATGCFHAQAFTWIEGDRHLGKGTAAGCQFFNFWVPEEGFERPAIGSAETTVSPFDTEPLYFECILTGLESSEPLLEFWCDDDPLTGRRSK